MTRSYQFNIIVRIIFIVLVSLAAGWSFSTGEPAYLSLTLIFILALQVINLILHINKINRKINYFFEAVRNEDYSLAFSSPKGDKILEKLSNNLERINNQIQKIHLENRRQEQYFRALIEHVGTGILSYNSEGFVIHANNSLKQLLGMKQFTHLRQLEKIDRNLASSVRELRHHDEKLITFNGSSGVINLLIKASSFRSNDQLLTLVSMQDIKKELDEKELDSWLKLIRVLTHEIMNSIAPVTSLSENLSNYYIKDGETIPVEEVDERIIRNTVRGLKVIHEQGQGLIRFVELYRKLTRLPEPEKSQVRVKELLEKTIMLCQSDLSDKKIKVSFFIEDEDMEIKIDEKQISQVLINLLRNSIEALENKPEAEIRLNCRKKENSQAEVSVSDNGPGIPPELIDDIFIPFFTTRETGSGIGLSISRQIMRQHGGSLKVRSIPGRETVFTMHFN